MDMENVAKAFNAWMDEYTKDPDAFESTKKTAMRHLNERLSCEEPSYGESCAATLFEYMRKTA